MSADRIEPSIDHEFTVEISTVTDRDSGATMMQFMFRTVREFSTFGYEIAIKDTSTDAPTQYAFELGGLSLPSHTNHSHGGAETSVLRVVPRDGTYPLTIRRRSRTYTAQITIADGKPRTVDHSDPGAFVRVGVGRA